MRANVDVDLGDFSERLNRAMEKKLQHIAQQIANEAVKNAMQYAGDRTPGTTYDAHVEIEGSAVSAELEASPRSEGADINLRIALGGRKAYTIRPRRAKKLVWPAGSKGDPIMGVASKVEKPAIAPVLGGEFMRKAMRNAISKVRNRYR